MEPGCFRSGLSFFIRNGCNLVNRYKALEVDKVLQSVLRQYFHQHEN